MPALAVDTHSIVWYLSADPRLSAKAADALDWATAAGELIHVPSICLVELTYLVEKGRLPVAARSRLIEALDDPATPCLLAPLDRLVADALESVSRTEIPDLPDRIVTAAAVALRVPLISRDGKICASQIQTIWYGQSSQPSGDFAPPGHFPTRSTTSISSVAQSLLFPVILNPNASRVLFRLRGFVFANLKKPTAHTRNTPSCATRCRKILAQPQPTNHQPPTTNNEQPTTNNQPAT